MGRRDFFEERKLKRLIYVFSVTLVISIIAFLAIFVLYNRKLSEQSSEQLLGLKEQSDIVSNEELNGLEEASSTSDKSISDMKDKTNTTKNANINKKEKQNVVNKIPVSSKVENTTNVVSENNIKNSEGNTITNEISNEMNTQEVQKELKFQAPVSGEIIKDFAMDTLIYSNTLEEWTTHSGIDIRADKTTVVVSAESGTIESIKTDPRYGLTVTIIHDNGFKTIYSNLLTTEFVTEGERVEKGQTIGTVGETSSFEIADESHLHFEMYKDGVAVNPTIYLKDV